MLMLFTWLLVIPWVSRSPLSVILAEQVVFQLYCACCACITSYLLICIRQLCRIFQKKNTGDQKQSMFYCYLPLIRTVKQKAMHRPLIFFCFESHLFFGMNHLLGEVGWLKNRRYPNRCGYQIVPNKLDGRGTKICGSRPFFIFYFILEKK